MGEKPVASCRATVFAVEPPSKKWEKIGNGAAAVGLYHNPTKGTYRIIGYLEKKPVLNSYITAKTNFRKASAKFYQWTNPTTKKLCGLTFPGETEGDKFAAHVATAIEKLKELAEAPDEDAPPKKVPAKKTAKPKPKPKGKPVGKPKPKLKKPAKDDDDEEDEEEEDEKPKAKVKPKPKKVTKPKPKPKAKKPPVKKQPPKKKKKVSTSWVQCDYFGVAIADFNPAEDAQYQVPLIIGDVVDITERICGWFKGMVTRTGKWGIFPASYVAVVEIDMGDRPVLDELASQVREWVELCRTAYEAGDIAQFTNIKNKIEELHDARETIMITSAREQDAVYAAKTAGKQLIEQGRRELGFDILTLTDNGEVADDQNCGIYDLWKMHEAVSSMDQGPDGSRISALKGDAKRNQSGSGTNAPGESKKDQIVNLVLEWKSFICPMGQDNSEVELFFSLYSQDKGETITDEFCVVLTDKGQPLDPEFKESDHRCIFRDISPVDISSRLYLVCRIVRLGKMINDDSKQKNPQDFRRVFGCAVVELTTDVVTPKDVAGLHQLKIFSHTPKQDNCDWNIHDNIINNQGDFQAVEMAMGCAVTLQATHGIFTQKEWASKGLIDLKVVDKIQYEVIMPGEVRNDLYIRFDQAEFSKDIRNSELTVKLLQNSGANIYESISRVGKPKDSEYRSVVLYHETKPRFNETICINIPREFGDKAHLYISVRHCSTGEAKAADKPLAFTFLRLNDPDGTMLKDGEHTLPVYKMAKDDTRLQPCWYLTEQDPKKLVVRKSECLTVHTTLTSTVLTQNAALLNLLKWRKASDLPSVLDRFLYTSKTDVVKFFQDIFDSLFDILEEHDDVSQAVYNAIVFLLGHMAEERGQNVEQFKKVLNIYINEHFKGYNAHVHLTSALKDYLNEPKKNRKELQSSIKALEYIFKLIIQSRQLYMDKFNVDASEESFMEEMEGLVDAFANLMDIDDPVLIGPQTLALRKSQTLFDNMTAIFDYQWVADEAVKFIQAIKTHDQKKLVEEKIKFLQACTEGELLMQEDARPSIFPVIIGEIAAELGKEVEDLNRALPVLGALLNHVTMFSEDDRISFMNDALPLLDPLQDYLLEITNTIVDVSAMPTEERTALGRLTAVVLSFVHLLEAPHYTKLYNAAKKKKKGRAHIMKMLKMLQCLLTLRVVPQDWFVINILRPRLALKVLETYHSVMKADFSENTLDEKLWTMFVKLLVQTTQSPALQLERQSNMNSQRVLDSYGDIRLGGVDLLKNTWVGLGEQQDVFVPGLARFMLDLMALEHDDIQETAMEIYFSMLQKEYAKSESLRDMEMATIDGFNTMVGEKRATQEFKMFFEGSLANQISNIKDKKFTSVLEGYCANVTQLIQMSLQLMALSDDPLFNDDRIYATTKVMEYLYSIERYEGYIQYAYQIVDAHLKNGDHGEAGYAQLLHADLLEFSDEVLPAMEGRFPEQTARDRKVKVLEEAMKNLNTGQCWEKATELAKELRNQYETVMLDYNKVADICKLEQEMFSNIVKVERLARAFYRCGFYGTSFPDTLRNNEFVYRAAPLEQLSVFQSKLTRKFPGAVFLPNKPVTDETKEKEGYFIQVAKADSAINLDAMPTPPAGQELPKYINDYFDHNRIKAFKMSRPLKKEGVKKNKENEFATLWLLETLFHLDGEFPGAQTRLLVKSRTEVELSPILNAQRSLEEKNAELRDFYTKYSTTKTNPSPYTMALNGCILALVNGGVMMYADAFFTDEYVEENPDDAELVQSCKDLLGEQVNLLGEGLVLHSKIVQEEMRALHNTLEDYFSKMKEDIQKVLV